MVGFIIVVVLVLIMFPVIYKLLKKMFIAGVVEIQDDFSEAEQLNLLKQQEQNLSVRLDNQEKIATERKQEIKKLKKELKK